jgi:hypothetical protein
VDDQSSHLNGDDRSRDRDRDRDRFTSRGVDGAQGSSGSPQQLGSAALLNSGHNSDHSPPVLGVSPTAAGQQAKVSEMLLKTLALDILSAKGPLPVGEIGKMLQEAIRVPSLSSILREYFGGLKKFLEKYSDAFLISNDHPFNPNVYIRSTLTVDDLGVIAKGKMPMHFELTYKKKGANRKKNNKTQGVGNGNLSTISSQLPTGDDIQTQLTQYFSSLPLSNHSSAASSSNTRLEVRGSFDKGSQQARSADILDKSMRRKSYPHEDANTSKMLKSLFGDRDFEEEETRLSDPFPINHMNYHRHSPNEYSSISNHFSFAGDTINSAAINSASAAGPGPGQSSSISHAYHRSVSSDELWAQGVPSVSEDPRDFGQPNPQAPVFIPQRNRFS